MLKSIESNKEIKRRIETEKVLFKLKDYFKQNIKEALNLTEVSAPLILTSGTGINDDLNGIESPVRFVAKSYPDRKMEIVQSLAKWKRLKLADFQVGVGEGIITDMKALRPDEIISPIHSVFVDQWDWEQRIKLKDRNLDYLKKTVMRIYSVLKDAERFMERNIVNYTSFLPEKIHFIHSEDLQYRYPKLTPKEREQVIAKDYGAVFIIGIGYELKDGVPHDLRAPDYDDWSTVTGEKYKGLNGDIIVWNPVLESAFELSSMGIRVDEEALLKQLNTSGTNERKELSFHKKLLKGELPLSIGGGIGQSRLAMLLLKMNDIKEVQAEFV